jgi:hypothetical protein
MTPTHRLHAATMISALCLCMTTDARAQQSSAAKDAAQLGSANAAQTGLRHKSDLGIRVVPIGVNITSDTGYRWGLFDTDNQLLRKTYIEAGVATGVSPAFGWVGGYVEALPVALLQLRASAQYMRYFGLQGFLYVPDPQASSAPAGGDSWDLDTIKDVMDKGGGVAGNGMMLELRATPRAKVGNVVFFAETRLVHIKMDLASRYYEPYYDLLLNPSDTFLMTRPTLGYVWGSDPARTYVLTGLRWEYTRTFGTKVSRTMPVGVVSWKLPSDWLNIGSPSIAGVGGFFLDHPNREGSLYGGLQLTLELGAI